MIPWTPDDDEEPAVSLRVRDALMRQLPALRHDPTDKRIRAVLGGETVLDSRRAVLVWEPKRIVPVYAVPEEDVRAELEPGQENGEVPPELAARPVLDPRVPFTVHTAPGRPLRIRAAGGEVAGFRLEDPDLAGHVLVDFAGMDAWYEEEEPNVGHPRDPFHRIDVVRSDRHVRVELEGRVLADSARPWLLFEPPLPVRYYLDPADVRMELLTPSATQTTCAYKGHASYWSLPDVPDVAWTYPEPLHDATEVAGAVAFFNEHVDLVVDGERLERPVTPWSRR
jgi:uncharacterized protein (DUF427 family)